MATKLEKPVSRELKIKDEFGHEGEVIVTMTGSGIELKKKRTSRKMLVEWKDLNKILKLPANAPAKHSSNPLGWLTQD